MMRRPRSSWKRTQIAHFGVWRFTSAQEPSTSGGMRVMPPPAAECCVSADSTLELDERPTAQQDAGPNDQERAQPTRPMPTSLARSSSSVSFALAISTHSMAQDEREKFLEWSASVGMSHSAAVRLLEHLPDDSALDPELPCWISSPSYSIAVNDPAHGGMGIETQLIQAGFLIIGSCPNGDPVIVGVPDSS